MSKKQGFSLVEALIITLVVSSAVAASLPALTTKVQKNDKSISPLGIKDARYWKRTKDSGDHIYYNGSIGVFVSDNFIQENSNTLNRGKALVLGQKTDSSGVSAITAYGKYNVGLEPPMGAGTRYIWSSKYGAFRAGYVDGTQWDPANLGRNSFAFGYNNIASGAFSNVYGGANNTASALNAAVYAGANNTASAEEAKVFSGKGNTVNDPYSEIYAGANNTIENCTVSGDTDSFADKNIIAAGSGNTITANANHAMIIAGRGATASEPYAVLVGTIDQKVNSLVSSVSSAVGDSGRIRFPSVWNANNVSTTHFFKEETNKPEDLLVKHEDYTITNPIYETPQYYMTFIFSNNKYILINRDGVTVKGGSSSDKRLKRDIKAYNSGLEKVLKLKPVTFKYKNDDNDATVEGFIAQDIKKIFPKTIIKDKKGYLQIEDSLLFAKIKLSLINATKELTEKIVSLEKDSDKMTNEVEKMKIRLEKMEKVKSNA